MRKIIALVLSALACGSIALTSQDTPDTERPPLRSDCVANVQGCLSSGIGGAPGGQPGHSRCSDCLRICEREGTWPDSTRYGADCR